MTARSQVTAVNGLSARCLVEGAGPPLLALHGWGGKAESFAPVAQALAATRTVYSLDLPGFGESDPPSAPWSVDEYGAWLHDWMDAVGLTAVPIVAHSFGARLALWLAARHPDRVEKMVLTGAAGLIPKRRPSYYLKVTAYKAAKRLLAVGWVARLLKVLGLDVAAYVQKRAGSSDYRQLSGVMRATFVRVVNQDLKPLLRQIRSPVLLIWGEKDTDTPLSFGRVMEREIPDAGLVVLPQAGHFAYLEQLPAFVRITAHFLEGKA